MKCISLAMLGIVSSAMPAFAATDEFNITPAEHAACDGDATRLCMSAYPDVDKMISCMVQNRNQLTPICLKTFDAGLRVRHIRIPSLSAER